jgi:hypothetical protein
MSAADIEAEIFGDGQQPEDDLPEEFKTMSAEDIQRRYIQRFPAHCCSAERG